jgi:hypothetical protein
VQQGPVQRHCIANLIIETAVWFFTGRKAAVSNQGVIEGVSDEVARDLRQNSRSFAIVKVRWSWG